MTDQPGTKNIEWQPGQPGQPGQPVEPGAESKQTFRDWLKNHGAGAYEEHLKVCMPPITTVPELAVSTPDILKKCYIDSYIAKQMINHAQNAQRDGVKSNSIPKHAAVNRINISQLGGGRHKKSRSHKRKSTRKRSKTSKRTH